MEHILVVTDLSSESEVAAAPALSIAEATGAKITLLHVTELASDVQSTAPHTATLDDYKKRIRILARDRMEELRVKAFGDRPNVRSVLTDGKMVWKSIGEYAAEHDVDMIVMSTHGRSGAKRMFIGSVAERVVRTAPCPVMTIRGGHDGSK